MQKEKFIDKSTFDLFDIHPESQVEYIAGYIINVLKNKGKEYKNITLVNFDHITFKNGEFIYSIFINDPDNITYCIYSSSKEDNLPTQVSGFFNKRDEDVDLDFLSKFLDKVDKNQWDYIKIINLTLSSLVEKYGDNLEYFIQKSWY